MNPQEQKKVTKKDVNKSFRELRDWQNCIVLNFSSDRKNRGNFIGKTDYEIITKFKLAVMVELKLYDDKLKIEQVNYGNAIINIDSNRLIYVIATENNYAQMKSSIATLDIKRLLFIQCESKEILRVEEKRLQELEIKRAKKKNNVSKT